MQNNRHRIIKIVILATAFFVISGCTLFDSKKSVINLEKKEINLEEDQTSREVKNDKEENSSEEVIISDEKNKGNEKETVAEKEEKKSLPKITNRLVNWGFSTSSSRKIDTIIIHSSYNAVGKDVHDAEDIIEKEYKPYGVSPHYIIDRAGKIYRLVEDKNIAYHAGESKVPDGRTGVNNFSLGIEIINTKTENPNSLQYESLKNLIVYLKEKYKIKYTLGHSDIASNRKDDPWNFDWKKIN